MKHFSRFFSSFFTVISGCFLIPAMVNGQSPTQRGDKLEIVPINVPSIDLSSQNLPFDIPFFFDCTMSAAYESLSYEYGLSKDTDKKRRWITFPDYTDPNTDPTTRLYKSQTVNAINNKISILCPGLHPNMSYKFIFTLTRSIPNDDKEKQALKDKIATALSDFFKTHATRQIGPAQINALQTNIDNIIFKHIKLAPKETLVYSTDHSNPYKTDFALMLPVASIINTTHNAIATANDNLKLVASGIPKAKTELQAQGAFILSAIDDLTAKGTKLSATTEAVIDKPFNPSLPDFKDYTLRNALTLLKQLAINPSLYESILSGDLKIVNNTLVGSTAADQQSIRFLSTLMDYLDQGIVQYTIKKSNRNPFNDNTLNLLFAIQKGIQKNYDDITINQALLQDAQKRIPDLTANLVILQTVTQDVITLPDVVTEKTPYISVEAGIGYSPGFSSAFSYYSANFYLSPVNKKAPMNSFKGWNYFKKTFCFQLGVANYYTKRPENTYSALGDNATIDLAVGIGFRVFRVLKVNAGILPYRTNNNNPLTDNYTLTANGYFSLGLDVNLLGALGKVGQLLKL